METNIVPYEVAKLLDEIGYNYSCSLQYDSKGSLIRPSLLLKGDSFIAAPSIFDSLKFIRKRFNIYVNIHPVCYFDYMGEKDTYLCMFIYKGSKKVYQYESSSLDYNEMYYAAIEAVCNMIKT